MELFGRLRGRTRARTLHFPVTLGRMNLAHRLNAVGTFSKVTGTIVDIAFYVNRKLITRLKNQTVCERVTTCTYIHVHTPTLIRTHTYAHAHVSEPVDSCLDLPKSLRVLSQLVVSGLEVHPIMEFSHFYCLHIHTKASTRQVKCVRDCVSASVIIYMHTSQPGSMHERAWSGFALSKGD